MRRFLLVVSVSAYAVGVAGEAAAQTLPDPEFRAEIVAAQRNYMDNVRESDAAALAAQFTKDGQVLAPGFDFVDRADLREFYQRGLDGGIKGVKHETLAVERYGDIAIETGRYTLLGEANKVMETGKYMMVWKKEGGEWKLHRDMWNAGPR